jgi:hypothetical protein
VGIAIADTADVHLLQCALANFDRTGGTGYGVQVTSTATNNGVGFQMNNSQISNSAYGVCVNGTGATDMRFSSNLWHSNTYALSVGVGLGAAAAAGGGGLQVTNDHFTYANCPVSTGYHLSMGSQAGDSTVVACYFDQSGASCVPVQMATAKVVFCSNHLLAYTGCTAPSLVKVTTASQELSMNANQMSGNGSSVGSMVQFTNGSITTALTGGTYTANTVYDAPSVTAPLIGSGGSAIAAASTSAVYVAGNVVNS